MKHIKHDFSLKAWRQSPGVDIGGGGGGLGPGPALLIVSAADKGTE